MKTTLAFIALASAVFAQSDEAPNLDPETPEQVFANHVQEVCFPYNETDGTALMDAPCNAAQNIIIQCTYGSQYNFTDSDSVWNEDTPMLSNTTQQACICESQFWDQQGGCNQCYEKHGDTDFKDVPDSIYSSMSSSYCAVSSTPTLAFADWLLYAGQSALSTISAPSTTATSYSDPLGNSTQVSLYFTPSVTGSAAWNAAVATGSISLHTISGQIVPTASGTTVASSSVNDASQTISADSDSAHSTGTTTTSHAAAGTNHVMAVAAGMVGFAGMVAML